MYAITCRKLVTVDGKTTFSDEESKFCTYTKCSKKEGKWDCSILPNADLKLNDTPVAVLVHGFNNTFETALDMGQRFTELFDVQVIVFSWPSAGKILDYFSDEKKASDSCVAFSSALRSIRQNMAGTTIKVSLMFHSMGNRLFKHFIQTLEKERDNCSFFENIGLVAADVPNEGHEKWCSLIPTTARTIIFVNEWDPALGTSSEIHEKTRLGNCRKNLNGPSLYIDCTPLEDPTHDLFYSTSPPLFPIFSKLLTGQDPTLGLQKQSDRVYILPAERTCSVS